MTPVTSIIPTLSLQENSTPEEHTLYVWDHFISKSLAKNIFIVAHSYGGLSFVNLVSICCYYEKPSPSTPSAHTQSC